MILKTAFLVSFFLPTHILDSLKNMKTEHYESILNDTHS